jgi:Fe-S-cluster containining protein
MADIRPPSGDAMRWVALHGIQIESAHRVDIEFECACTKLTAEGRCSIYDDRPLVCRDFRPGCNDCLEYVRKRRTPEDYARIRDASDPETIH